MITYIEGNLFDRPAPPDGTIRFICHVANNICVMGSGFALGLIRKYPIVKRENRSRCLGNVEFIPVELQITVCNMIAQHETIRQNSKPIRYAALVECMELVAVEVEENIEAGLNVEIVCPKFGSLRAGGNWDFIVELIEEIWKDIPVFVYVYKE